MVEAGPGLGAGCDSGGSVVWRDEAALAVYRLTAVSGLGPDQYLVRVSSDCGYSGYSCLALQSSGGADKTIGS